MLASSLSRHVMGALALAIGVSALLASSVDAQNPPATYYGFGLVPKDQVEAFIDGRSCGAASADDDGAWVLRIPENASCQPSEGDEITFTLNGRAAEEREIWMSGASPADLVSGISLTLFGPGILVGDLPPSGFALVIFGGTFNQLREAMLALSCAAPIFATAGGGFVPYFPTTTLTAPNSAFRRLFPHGIPIGTPLLGGNCPQSGVPSPSDMSVRLLVDASKGGGV